MTRLYRRKNSTNPLDTSALELGGWSESRPGRFTPGKDAVHIVQETGRFGRGRSGRAWNPDHAVRSESLYRLSYPGSFTTLGCWVMCLTKYGRRGTAAVSVYKYYR
jgi:hypothetical protein